MLLVYATTPIRYAISDTDRKKGEKNKLYYLFIMNHN